jgi:hypothetical protein
MIRPLLSLKRLFFDEKEGKVRYQYSNHGSQQESMDYLDLPLDNVTVYSYISNKYWLP